MVVVSGPSGVGKSTICKEVMKRLTNAYLSVSVTTRSRAASEVDGREYWFISREEFERLREKGLLLEYAEVFENFYGTRKEKVDQALAAGKVVILEIDVQGGRQVKRIYPDAVMIFILPPRTDELVSRIKGRAREDQKTAEKRLRQANSEIAAAKGLYEHQVVNDDLEKAVEQVVDIIKLKS